MQHDVVAVGERCERRLRAHAGDRVGGIAEGEDDRAAVLRRDDDVALAGLIGDVRAEPVEEAPQPRVARGDREVALHRRGAVEDQAGSLEPEVRRALLRERAGRAREERAEEERE